jgi:hypothetical protein
MKKSVFDNEFIQMWSRDRKNDGNICDTRIFSQFRTSWKIITLYFMFL